MFFHTVSITKQLTARVSCASGLKFKSWAGYILHNVAKGATASTSTQVAVLAWCNVVEIGLACVLATRLGVMQRI